MKLLYAFLFSSFVIFVMSNNYAYALYGDSTSSGSTVQMDTYEKTGFTLIHNPMICIFEPASNPLNPNLGSESLQDAEDMITYWNNALRDSSNLNTWHIASKEISYDKVASFDSSKCDITISFQSSPNSSPNSEEPVGITTYDFFNHKAQIVIYYLHLATAIHQQLDDARVHIYYETIFTGYLPDQIATESQIRSALLHELGHAFGLGHDVTSHTSSVMSLGEISLDGSYGYGKIIPSDVQQLKYLYGENGFNAVQSQTVSQTVMPLQPAPVKPTITISITLLGEIHDWSMDKMGDSGFVDFVNGLAFENAIKLPRQGTDSTITIPSWVKKDTQLWFQGDIPDEDFINAIQYLINNRIIILN